MHRLTEDPLAARRPARKRRSGRVPAIDPARCTGCGRCVAACELHLLSLETLRWEKFAVLHDAPSCTGCNACTLRCPFDAIELRKPAPGAGGSAMPPLQPAPDAT